MVSQPVWHHLVFSYHYTLPISGLLLVMGEGRPFSSHPPRPKKFAAPGQTRKGLTNKPENITTNN